MDERRLDKYQSMRDFSKTPEPSGGQAGGGMPTFVIQKHAATALHYDFRLQVDDVMPSWAVPKGPSYDPKIRRLAVQTEDHPLDYQNFEGIIPSGEYGGGEVIIWDRGTYERISSKPGPALDMRSSITEGHFTVMLYGEKLIGEWSLIRTGHQNGKDTWVMVKHKDKYVNADLDVVRERPESVISGQTIEDLKKQTQNTKTTWIAPMLAQLTKVHPSGPNWIYERKLDGLRCLAIKESDSVELWSRNQLSFTKRFPEIVRTLQELPIDDFVFDGELVAFDQRGRTSFSLLQQDKSVAAQLYVFDILRLLGQNTMTLPLGQRKELVTKAIDETNLIKVIGQETGNAETLLEKARANGWEGVIAKKADSKYVSGRSSNWLKLKCVANQELVIGGWTEPQGTRVGFGALLVGYYDDSGFRYAGKVGTGFSADLLVSLHSKLKGIEHTSSPFVDPVKEKNAHWATPDLVANVTFAEWTSDGRLRHPSFAGLRNDKKAIEVKREQ